MNRRLLWIYIGYFLVLGLAFMHSFLPMLGHSVRGGVQYATMAHPDHSQYLVYVQPELFATPWSEMAQPAEGVALHSSLCEGFIAIVVDGVAHPHLNAMLESYNGAIEWLDWLSILAWVVILVLTGMIINSLRKSVRDQKPLPSSNIGRMRVIGALIILTQLLAGANYLLSHKMVRLAAPELAGYCGGFNLEYGEVIMGLILLFAAEIFALGSRLSEEQHYTI